MREFRIGDIVRIARSYVPNEYSKSETFWHENETLGVVVNLDIRVQFRETHPEDIRTSWGFAGEELRLRRRP